MPRFVVEIAIEPLSANARDKLAQLLDRPPEDLSEFKIAADAGSGRTILCCQGLEQISPIVNWLRRELGQQLDIGQRQVAYRETLGVPTEVNYTHKKQTGGTGQFARVKIQFEPLPPGGGEIFESKIVGGSVPREYIPGVEKGLKSVAESGIIAGFPVIDYKATLIDGAYHDVDSSVLAFEIASRAAFREAAKTARPKLLEPIMKVEVIAPNEYVAPILRDLRSRRAGEPMTRREEGDAVIVAEAPLARLFDYEDALAQITDGRGRFVSVFARYAPVPNSSPPDDDLFPPAVGKRA